MGYVTDSRGRLVCDSCGETGARKRRCPVGYCPPSALCASCNGTVRGNGTWAKAHAECPRLSAEYHAELAAKAAEPTHYSRSARGDWADGVPTGMVEVVTWADTVLYMPVAEYREVRGSRLPDAYVATAVPVTDQPRTKEVVLA